MSDRIKKIKIKQADGTMSGYYPIGADAQNIDFNNGFNLDNIVGSINPDESGSIATQLSKSIKYYDCVADMKADTTLNGGGAARTLGYYEPGDGGAGLYEIIDDSDARYSTSIDDGGSVHDLTNGNKALLNIINDTINILQFGAKGDGVTNNLTYFNNANKSMASIIEFPYSEQGYFTTYLEVPQNKIWRGLERKKRTLIKQYRNNNSFISIVRHGGTLENIELDGSLDTDKEWNRLNVQNNTLIKNCKITGMLNPTNLNSWGIYISSNFQNISIIDCEFENNSQADIAIVDGCKHIIISNCKGWHLNFEPNNDLINQDILVDNCAWERVSTLENTFKNHPIQDLTISNCTIDEWIYRGANVNLINNIINSITVEGAMGGEINNINSFGLGRQINDDPNFYNLDHDLDTNYFLPRWRTGYSQASNMLTRQWDEQKGNILVFNQRHQKAMISIMKDFYVDSNSVYCIRTLMNSITNTETFYSGHGLAYCFYDEDDQTIGDMHYVCIDRNIDIDNESTWSWKTCFFTTPKNVSYVRIYLSNTKTGSNSYTQTKWKYLLLNKVEYNTNHIDSAEKKTYGNTYPKTLFPVVGNTYTTNLKGDKIYLDTETLVNSDFEGYICVNEGNPPTWKKFGNISSIS